MGSGMSTFDRAMLALKIPAGCDTFKPLLD